MTEQTSQIFPRRTNIDVLVENLPLDGLKVLDIGCGNGAMVRALAKRGATPMGVDPSEVEITAARSESPVADERYEVSGAEALPFQDNSFDAAIFFNSLHHIPAELMADGLEEAARVVKSQGLIYVAEPLAQGPHFQAMLPVEDETVMRAQAYDALRGFTGGKHCQELREIVYEAPILYPDFQAFRDRIVAADAQRADRIAEVEPELRAAFEGYAESQDDKYLFAQPMRINLLQVK
ncbi:class I SAM-dependent methyltransferase [Fodinicurvata sediminis]|uniref:class I SAM-dependent methyltransferase n=1 Tax=Fodinicurvata sediminis TaxID=1121832 RepID=UPI0003B6E9BB|nr:class I SAM-dependent methyltransferase [Fodinicurvata sediminis]